MFATIAEIALELGLTDDEAAAYGEDRSTVEVFHGWVPATYEEPGYYAHSEDVDAPHIVFADGSVLAGEDDTYRTEDDFIAHMHED